MSHRRAIAAAALALCLLLSACAGNPSAPIATPIISTPAPMDVMQAQEGNRLTIALCGEMGDFHPLTSTEKEARSFLGLLFEGLIEVDENGEIQPNLASSWTPDASGRSWTFHLRTQVQWHSGGTLTAQDVASTLDLIRQIGSDGPYAYVTEALSSWDAVDDSTLTLSFGDVSYAGLYLLDFPILPQSAGYTADSAPRLLPGSGPYEISDITEGEKILLTRNDDWWKLPPQIESISAVFFTNIEAATSALSLRQVDVVETTSITTDQYKYGNNASVFEYNTGYLEGLYFNLETYVLQNRYIRQAISYALDRSSLAETAYVRHAVVVDTPISPASSLYKGTTLQYIYDPTQAQRLIARTGWEDTDEDGVIDTAPSGTPQKLSLRLVTSDSTQREEAAQAIARQLRQVGLDITLSILPWEDYLTAIEEKQYDLLLAGSYLDPSPEYSRLLGTNGSLNLSGYSDSAMDEALAAAKNAKSLDELTTAAQTIRSLYLTDLPMLCLYYRTHSLLLSAHVQGVSYAQEGNAYCRIAEWTLDRTGS